jgi:hypothetical protein
VSNPFVLHGIVPAVIGIGVAGLNVSVFGGVFVML